MARQMLVFDLKSLHRVEGLAEDFDTLLKTLVRDAMERPGVKKKRQVKVCVDVTPMDNGDDIDVVVRTASTLPARTAVGYRMLSTAKGGLKFNPTNPDTPEQADFLEDD